MISLCLTLVLTLAFAPSCLGQGEERISPKSASSYIGAVLNGSRASGSLVYSGSCGHAGASEDLPALRMPPRNNPYSLQSLREMFAGDPKMRVEAETGGKIRMVERATPLDILNVKVLHLSFTTHPDPLRSPTMALWAIIEAPEVRAFMDANRIGPKRRDAYGFSIPLYSESISGDLDNVTVAQALDFVLKTYPGFWAYENCESERVGRTVFITFFPSVPPSIVGLPQANW